MAWSKYALGHILYLGSCNGVDTLQQVINISFPSIMQEVLGKVQGILFAIITSNNNLSLQLDAME